MRTLLLPGSNPETIDWIKALAEKIGLNTENAVLHNYSFWSEDSARPNLSHETSFLPVDSFDLVLAKSLGSLVMMQAHHEGRLQWKRAVLLGVPIRSFRKTALPQEALSLLKDKDVYIIQQAEDPFGTSTEFGENRPVNLLSINGNDHLYDDYDQYITQIRNWLG